MSNFPVLSRDRSGRVEVLHEDGSGVEEVEAAALGVLLGLRCGLGGDHADVAACGSRLGEAREQERGLDAMAAVGGERGGAGELGDAFGCSETGSARDFAV